MRLVAELHNHHHKSNKQIVITATAMAGFSHVETRMDLAI